MTGAPTRRPLLPVITIKKNDATTYTFNHFTSTYDFRLRRLQCAPAFDAVGGAFAMTVASSDASNSAANTFLSDIEEGNEVTIWIGKTDASKTKIFLGVIEDIEIEERNKNYMDIHISGPDWGSDILKNRFVTGYWEQKKTAGTDTLDASDNTVLVEQIAQDLLQNVEHYLVNDFTAEDQGIVVNSANFQSTSYRIPVFSANGEKLDDKLSELDSYGRTIHFVDPDKNFIMRYPLSTDSQVLLTDDVNDSLISTWASGKVGYIYPGTKYKKTLENTFARIIAVGGDKATTDQSQLTITGGPDSIHNQYLAMKFTPVQARASTILVHVRKTGSPTESLKMQLIEDNGGEPTGTIVKEVSEHQDRFTAGTARWVPFNIGEDINTALDHWIVLLEMAAGDASNTYEWYKTSGSTSYTNATSADGTTWTVNANSEGYAYEYRALTPLIQQLPPSLASATTKHFHEDLYNKPDLNDLDALYRFLLGEWITGNKRKEIFKGKVYAPDTLLQTGQTVRIRKQQSGYVVDGHYVIGRLEYVFENIKSGIAYNIEAAKFSDYY